jgi:alkanesulfonate monooxygenase SsuD/methylene tetrahydromethanopterin reductase-like flavin-dependent oxidoreductase (luciferase family)
MSSLDFYLFHLLPYPDIPPGDELETTWVTLPNSSYDPGVGARLSREYLDQLVAAEALGYDGVCLNEHHQTPYSVTPSPGLVAAMVAARTERIPIVVLGNALPLHQSPLRVAEEIASLDVLSGGRVIAGFMRGAGMEYYSTGVNPAHADARFWEAHDLIVEAWTRPGPFAWEGEHFDLPFVNPWPRPLQDPHPPIWLPGTGALDTIDRAAELRYPFVMVFAPQRFTRAAFDQYRRAASDHGYEPSPSQLATVVPCYVADSDEAAEREVRPHVEWLFHTALKVPPQQWFPPGYMTPSAFGDMLRAKVELGMKDHWELTWEELIEERYVIAGSAETVVSRLTELADDVGAGVVLGAGGQIGSMPHSQAMESAARMAEEVFPHFR